MANNTLKRYAFANGVKLWEVANKLGIHDSNLSRKLRYEFNEADALKFRTAVDDIVKEKEANR